MNQESYSVLFHPDEWFKLKKAAAKMSVPVAQLVVDAAMDRAYKVMQTDVNAAFLARQQKAELKLYGGVK